jgi:capsular polysaccharide biosynthesis protein
VQLDFRQIWNGIRKRWWLALIVTLAAAAAAYLYTNAQPRVYQAQTTLSARAVPPDNGLVEAIKKQMPTYAQEMGSKALLQYVVDNNLIRDVDLNAVAGQVKVQARPDEQALVMTVDHTDALKSAQLAEAIANEFVARQDAESQNATIATGNRVVWVVAQPAEVPSRPYQPRPLLYTGAAALFGLILGLLLAIVLELMDTTLKTPAEVRQYTGLNTLGIIPRSSK